MPGSNQALQVSAAIALYPGCPRVAEGMEVDPWLPLWPRLGGL